MKHPPSSRPDPPRRAATGFTLVEMLGVLTIVGILTTLTVLGVRGVNGTASRKAAVSNLMGVLDQARMRAISDGRPTYVVFVSAPKNQTDLNTSTLPDTMWGRAYALFEDPSLTDTVTSFSPTQLSNWLYLPTGVAFKCNSAADNTPPSVTATPRLTASTSPPDSTQFSIASRTSTATVPLVLPYIRFDPQGQVVDSGGNLVDANAACLRILLFQGIASSGSVETVTRQAATGANGVNYALDEILLKPTTGRAQYTLNPVNNSTP